ncbi:hypothetical protein GCM10022237_31320 [Nocardioides ginsengisoli]|uniref:Uncharacterized protein n=1 Tax=Nocardioides ginsengisoli TaxID=363868 RepID=A0ABW3VU11_9ACTN
MAFAIGLVLGSAATAAWAGVDQTGRYTDVTDVDGTSAMITAESFSTPPNACVVYAALVVAGGPSPRQLEAGFLRCRNVLIDQKCRNDYRFVERFDGLNYYCNEGATFNNGDSTFVTIARTPSGSSTTMQASLVGTSMNQSGFSLTSPTTAQAWGEVTGGSSCPTGPARADFATWKKLRNGSWTYITGANYGHAESGINGPCFAVSSLDSTGDFHVTH